MDAAPAEHLILSGYVRSRPHLSDARICRDPSARPYADIR